MSTAYAFQQAREITPLEFRMDATVDARIAAADYELTIDSFCGGGGASMGMEQATGRPVDIAINHNQLAIDMHRANHPNTRHYNESVWAVDPVKATHGKPVGVAWFSPDCRHFSKAKGGKPVSREIRGLAWIVLKWAGLVRPRVIQLENVPEFRTWGPLTRSGRPIKERKGETFDRWREQLESLGYQTQFRSIKCSKWGVPTTRTRLFMIARCDGEPIVWPSDTHGAPGLLPEKSTADHVIDWTIPTISIFDRPAHGLKPLVVNTQKRIVNGLEKFVVMNPDPFILRLGQTGWNRNGQVYDLADPLTTITSKAEHCIVTPTVLRHFGTSNCADITEPLPTVTGGGGGKAALVAAFLGRHKFMNAGADLNHPLPTITSGAGAARPAGAAHSLALQTSHLIKFRGTNAGSNTDDPLQTISAGGNHHGEIRTMFERYASDKFRAAYMLKYYGSESSDSGHNIQTPLDSVTSKGRFGLVVIEGELWQFTDIGMRMLQPHELYKAHDFPSDYQFTHNLYGEKFTKAQQVAMVGNSVPPEMSKRMTAANFSPIRNYKITPINKYKRG